MMNITFDTSETTTSNAHGNSSKKMNGVVLPEQTPSLLQSMMASLSNNPMGFDHHPMQAPPSFVSHSGHSAHSESQYNMNMNMNMNTSLHHSPLAGDTTGISHLFGDLPADAFEPVPIGGNTRTTSAPPMDASILEGVLDLALGVVCEPDALNSMSTMPRMANVSNVSNVSNVPINVRKAAEPPITACPPRPKKRRISNDQQPRFRGYQEKQWEEQFEELLKFKEQEGHCLVPHTYPENQVLSRWVKRQRYQYKLKAAGKVPSTMTDVRIKKLEDIGFVWDSHATAWVNRLKELEEYREKHGDCNVPSNYPANPELATWIKCQRRQYKLFWAGNKSSSMTVERMNKLNEVGFIWKVREDLPMPAHPSLMMF
ncbi:unnamed protein product [Cylindrotheca closterium]|uniref:Helicase-associated domain-containing protein n=1 Tax=Cylindrotheca closterium TaxID=2856 RepID=A0AAD2JLB2_9STRA|nr:unnamed protein product [Cylindrotheca closterium]